MKDARAIVIACRIYRVVLHLYPRAHGREYSALMEQLFRDQCRLAWRNGSPSLLALRTLGDLARSLVREHLAQQSQDMKNLNPSKLALILLIAALLLHQWAVFVAARDHDFASVLLTGSALALMMRAVAEAFRPRGEEVRGLLWGAGVALLYAFIFPAWKHYTDDLGVSFPSFPPLLVVGSLANGLVPLGKALLRIFQRRTV